VLFSLGLVTLLRRIEALTAPSSAIPHEVRA
jgi:hypothetical protein